MKTVLFMGKLRILAFIWAGCGLVTGCSSFRQESDFIQNQHFNRQVASPVSFHRVSNQQLWSCMSDRQQQSRNQADRFGWLLSDENTDLHTPVPYIPREGDLVVTTSCCHHVRLFKLAGSGHPLHVGILVKDQFGELKLLESTVVDRGVTMNPVEERLVHFLQNHRSPLIWIRPIQQPLTAEQSSKLTAFAESQRRKRFAFVRSAAFVLPGERVFRSSANQWTWFCTELVIEGLNGASLISTDINPASILPEDIYHNRKIDLNEGWLPAVTWSQTPEWPNDRPKGAPMHPEQR